MRYSQENPTAMLKLQNIRQEMKMYVANSNNMTTIEEIKVIGCQVA